MASGSAPGKIQTAGRQEKLCQARPDPWHSPESKCPLWPLLLSGQLRDQEEGDSAALPVTHSWARRAGCRKPPSATPFVRTMQHPKRRSHSLAGCRLPGEGLCSQLSLARVAAVSPTTRGSVWLIPTHEGHPLSPEQPSTEPRQATGAELPRRDTSAPTPRGQSGTGGGSPRCALQGAEHPPPAPRHSPLLAWA